MIGLGRADGAGRCSRQMRLVIGHGRQSERCTVPSKPIGSTPNQRGHPRPEPFPAEDVAVDDVERLVPRRLGVSAAQTRCLASTRASVMSERPFHCACEPGQRNGRPVSLQIEA